MPKQLTHEEFIERLTTKHTDISVIDSYIDMHTKIRCKCKNKHIWYATPSNILQGCGCPHCAGRYRTLDSIQRELNEINSRIIIKEYTNMKTDATFMCEKGHQWHTKPGYVLHGTRCPYCANKKILIGFNDLWTTHPHIAQLLKNPEDGYNHTYGSGSKVVFICPDCHNECFKAINLTVQRGLVCDKCSDGISYPNKFSMALLELLPVNNVQHEWQPEWLKPYSYDNYFEYNNQKYVLEMDGGLGHGKKDFKSQGKDITGMKHDKIKDSLASERDIIVIRIDCDYPRDNRFEYIRNNIINSELNMLFDLTNIDWRWCNEQGMRKMVKEVAELYNQGLSIKEICQQTRHSQTTISRWLRQAKSIGLCNYNALEAKIRGGRTITKHNIAVNQYTMDGSYIATYISMAAAKRKLGLSGDNISLCCGNPKRSTGGFRWYKASDINQPDKSKIFIDNTQQNDLKEAIING